LSDEEERRWVARIEQELVIYCDLLRQIYGKPSLVGPGAAADGGA
jgi:hypothetical protein